MRLAVALKKLADPGPIADFAHKRATSALDHLSHAVERVRITIEDINGPRGGVDKRCVVEVQGAQLGRVRVASTGLDAHSAVTSGVDRAVRAVTRALDRRRAQVRGRVVGLAAASGSLVPRSTEMAAMA